MTVHWNYTSTLLSVNMVSFLKQSLNKAETDPADGKPSGNIGPLASVCRASLFGVFHTSALVGLTSAAVFKIQGLSQTFFCPKNPLLCGVITII